MSVPYDDIDPGIREVVIALNGSGFRTSDSGDGVSKKGTPLEGCMMETPNVVMTTPAHHLVAEADRLRCVLESWGVRVGPTKAQVEELAGPQSGDASEYGHGVSIQGSYDPGDQSAIIMLLGLDDKLLAECKENG